MKKTILISAVISCLFLNPVLSQEQGKSSFRKNQIGIQLNPFINEQFFDFRYMNTVAAVRYGYRFTKNITTGMEFACSFPIDINSGQSFKYFDYFSYRIGFYTRYSILSERRIQLFAEASPFFSHYRRDFTSSSDSSPYTINKFGYYVAPGITLYSKSKRISFDLFYKFSNLTFANGNKSVLSYKINFNF
jgi:hypothetical protein